MRTRPLVTLCAALALVPAVAAGCGSDGGGGEPPRPAEQIDIGDPITATNEDAAGVVGPGATEAPEAGVVEGGPDESQLEDIAPPDEEALAQGSNRCSAPDAQPSASTLRETASSIRCLLNAERRSRGLRPLRSNSRLARAARLHSRDMVSKRYFSHDARDGRSMLDRIRAAGYLRARAAFTVGENIGWGSGSLASPRALVRAWMDSPPHRANILHRRYREIGIGLVLGAPSPGVSGAAVTATTNFGG